MQVKVRRSVFAISITLTTVQVDRLDELVGPYWLSDRAKWLVRLAAPDQPRGAYRSKGNERDDARRQDPR
jgi:hypothetical protein